MIMEHSNKNEFLQKLEAKLAEIKGSIDNLKADMESAAEDQKIGRASCRETV